MGHQQELSEHDILQRSFFRVHQKAQSRTLSSALCFFMLSFFACKKRGRARASALAPRPLFSFCISALGFLSLVLLVAFVSFWGEDVCRPLGDCISFRLYIGRSYTSILYIETGTPGKRGGRRGGTDGKSVGRRFAQAKAFGISRICA